MNLPMLYTKMAVLNTFRNKSAFFFGVIFPVILFLMFGHYDITDPVAKTATFVVFSNYAVQTVFLLSLGMNISMKRSSEWTIYLRTLPAPPSSSMIGTIAEKSLTALLALLLVVLANSLIYGMILSWPMTFYLIFSAMIGGMPMAFLGTALGYRVSPELGRSVFVFINLALLFVAISLPDHGFWHYVRLLMPTQHWTDIVMSHLIPNTSTITPWFWMAGYTVVFYLFALWSYKNRKNLRKE
jgi:hypothetical protein